MLCFSSALLLLFYLSTKGFPYVFFLPFFLPHTSSAASTKLPLNLSHSVSTSFISSLGTFFFKIYGGVDWIQLSQDRDRWQAVVSAVMNLRVLAPRS
jgi:hypothetical protein